MGRVKAKYWREIEAMYEEYPGEPDLVCRAQQPDHYEKVLEARRQDPKDWPYTVLCYCEGEALRKCQQDTEEELARIHATRDDVKGGFELPF